MGQGLIPPDSYTIFSLWKSDECFSPPIRQRAARGTPGATTASRIHHITPISSFLPLFMDFHGFSSDTFSSHGVSWRAPSISTAFLWALREHSRVIREHVGANPCHLEVLTVNPILYLCIALPKCSSSVQWKRSPPQMKLLSKAAFD